MPENSAQKLYIIMFDTATIAIVVAPSGLTIIKLIVPDKVNTANVKIDGIASFSILIQFTNTFLSLLATYVPYHTTNVGRHQNHYTVNIHGIYHVPLQQFGKDSLYDTTNLLEEDTVGLAPLVFHEKTCTLVHMCNSHF